MGFKPGQSGNPNGRAKQKIWRDAILGAIRNKHGDDLLMAAKNVAQKLVDAADNGDVSALKEIGDRIDGKSEASVSVDHTGSVTHEHEGIPETLGWLRGIRGTETTSETPKPLPN